jgi:hypothetical protein
VLEPWIIEQIRRREEEERRQRERPHLDIPARDERWKPEREPEDPERDREDSDRGVVIIDI